MTLDKKVINIETFEDRAAYESLIGQIRNVSGAVASTLAQQNCAEEAKRGMKDWWKMEIKNYLGDCLEETYNEEVVLGSGLVDVLMEDTLRHLKARGKYQEESDICRKDIKEALKRSKKRRKYEVGDLVEVSTKKGEDVEVVGGVIYSDEALKTLSDHTTYAGGSNLKDYNAIFKQILKQGTSYQKKAKGPFFSSPTGNIDERVAWNKDGDDIKIYDCLRHITGNEYESATKGKGWIDKVNSGEITPDSYTFR